MMGYVISQYNFRAAWSCDEYKFRLSTSLYKDKKDFDYWLGNHNNYILNIGDQKNV